MQRVFGLSGEKKKKKRQLRLSFGDNKTEYYFPDSKEQEAMHGNKEPRWIPVVVVDKPVYKEWRNLHEAEFVQVFNKRAETLGEDHAIAKQTLHAARVVGLLGELDPEVLRTLVLKVFPRYKTCFPRLMGKQGNSQMKKFLGYVEERLVDDCSKAHEDTSCVDRVTDEERGHKDRELEFIPDSPPTTA